MLCFYWFWVVLWGAGCSLFMVFGGVLSWMYLDGGSGWLRCVSLAQKLIIIESACAQW